MLHIFWRFIDLLHCNCNSCLLDYDNRLPFPTCLANVMYFRVLHNGCKCMLPCFIAITPVTDLIMTTDFEIRLVQLTPRVFAHYATVAEVCCASLSVLFFCSIRIAMVADLTMTAEPTATMPKQKRNISTNEEKSASPRPTRATSKAKITTPSMEH